MEPTQEAKNEFRPVLFDGLIYPGELSFWEAINDDPDEVTNRIALSDWLRDGPPADGPGRKHHSIRADAIDLLLRKGRKPWFYSGVPAWGWVPLMWNANRGMYRFFDESRLPNRWIAAIDSLIRGLGLNNTQSRKRQCWGLPSIPSRALAEALAVMAFTTLSDRVRNRASTWEYPCGEEPLPSPPWPPANTH